MGRERTVDASQSCSLLPLAEMAKSRSCMHAKGRYASSFSSVAEEGGIPETNKTVIIEPCFCAPHHPQGVF